MTRTDLLHLVRERLIAADIADAALDARALLDHVCPRNVPPGVAETIDAKARDAVLALVARRIAGEPVDRIIGRRGFWTLDLALSPGTLSPRPDSETVVRAALQCLPLNSGPQSHATRIVDLGCGSGALLLAVLAERPQAWGAGIDLSPDALRTARRNAEAHGLGQRSAFVCGNWLTAIAGPFDLVLCNPPYIPSGDIPTLDREVRDHDPHLALDGGADGLDVYATIFSGLAAILAPGAAAVFEIGIGQHDSVPRLAERAGLRVDTVQADLGGIPRAVVLRAG